MASILLSLKKRGCSSDSYELIQSYLTERKATIISATHEEGKDVTKGCPQGSVLGPLFWNLIFDENVETLRGNGNEPIAFADDLIVVIRANSRKELEQKPTTSQSHWCEKQKLELPTKKSEILLLKGSLEIRRPPTTKIDPTTMKMKPVVRYLGIHLGTRMNITLHIKYVTEKSKNLFAGFVKLVREHWGLDTKIIRTI